MLLPTASGRRALLLGAAHVGGYAAATLLLPTPSGPKARLVLCGLAMALPALLAFWATARRARQAQGAERVLWAFLCACCALHTLSVGLFLARASSARYSGLAEGLGVLAHHGSFVLLAVGLLARPDRPREARDVRASAHEALSLAVCVAFLVAYFLLLAPWTSIWPTFLLFAAEDVLPAVLALVLWRRVAPSDAAPYRVLAAGLGLAALFAVPGSWLSVQGRYLHYGPLDVAWLIPYWTMVVAATSARVPWLAAAKPPREPERSRWMTSALVLPPLVDLLARAGGLPGDPQARTLLALCAFAVLAVLASLRLRADASAPVGSPTPPGASPSRELLRLATGTAHELNNPLMAVAVASELAVARGGAEAPLRALQEAVHATAGAIRRFQLTAADSAGSGEER